MKLCQYPRGWIWSESAQIKYNSKSGAIYHSVSLKSFFSPIQEDSHQILSCFSRATSVPFHIMQVLYLTNDALIFNLPQPPTPCTYLLSILPPLTFFFYTFSANTEKMQWRNSLRSGVDTGDYKILQLAAGLIISFQSWSECWINCSF